MHLTIMMSENYLRNTLSFSMAQEIKTHLVINGTSQPIKQKGFGGCHPSPFTAPSQPWKELINPLSPHSENPT